MYENQIEKNQVNSRALENYDGVRSNTRYLVQLKIFEKVLLQLDKPSSLRVMYLTSTRFYFRMD